MTLKNIDTLDINELMMLNGTNVLMQSRYLFGDDDFHRTEILFYRDEPYFWAKFKLNGQWTRKMFFYSYYPCNIVCIY